MSNLALRSPIPHGRNDIGWKVGNDCQQAHWFMSTRVSSVAISHCGEVIAKSLLTDERKRRHCLTCQLIEQMRSELDGKNDNHKK